MKTLFTFMLFAFVAVLAAAELPPGVKMEPSGELKVLNTSFQLYHFNRDWRGTTVTSRNLRVLSGAPETFSGKFELDGKWAAERELQLDLRERITVTAADTLACSYRVGRAAPFYSSFIDLAWSIPTEPSLPQIAIDGTPLAIPAESVTAQQMFRRAGVRSVTVVTGNRTVTVTGNFEIQVVDCRQWKQPRIEVRFVMLAESGMLTEAGCDFTLYLKPVVSRPVDLAAACNMSFADETAGDQRGGWSDQGPENDMRKFKPGEYRFNGALFTVPDPAANGGKSCIVLSNRENVCWPPVASVSASGRGKMLYLLHAAGWNKAQRSLLGTIRVDYRDGTHSELPVETARECGNWWMPSSMPNGSVVWRDANPSSPIGLYLSQFPLEDRELESISFRCIDRAMWMVVAASIGDTRLEFAAEPEPVRIVEGGDFVRLDFVRLPEAGSPLDFSGLLDAPAGKYGRVGVAPDGHFQFENAPLKRIRFNGINLCMEGIFYSHADADKLVEELAFNGYNAVRLHQFDSFMTAPEAADTTTFDPERLDRFDYLIAALKKRGFYLTLDLYNLRTFKPGDRIGDVPYQLNDAMRSLIAVSPDIQANWKKFARNLLDHVNPYTKMRLTDDPALVFVNLSNENPLLYFWDRTPESALIYVGKYHEMLRRNGLDTEENRRSRGALFSRFLNELQRDVIRDQKRFLRDGLGMKALVTDVNFLTQPVLTHLRGELDLIDNHMYWDHPRFLGKSWQTPLGFRQESSISRFAEMPREAMASRMFGRPFTVTESNFCHPNLYRAENGPLIGGYAALQGWDAVYRFDWSYLASVSGKPGIGPSTFDVAGDPLALLSERIVSALLVRGDAAEAKESSQYGVGPEAYEAIRSVSLGGVPMFPEEFAKLGLFARIGSGTGGKPGATPPAEAKLFLDALAAGKPLVSATGELVLDPAANTFRVVTPCTETLTAPGGALSGDVLSMTNGNAFQTVALISLDRKPLRESRSMLLLHLPMVFRSGTTFRDETCQVLLHSGKLPLLVRRGTADLTLRLAPEGGTPHVELLSPYGKRLGEAPGEWADGRFRFRLDAGRIPGGVLAYHLTRR